MHRYVRNALLVSSEYFEDSWCLDCDIWLKSPKWERTMILVGGWAGVELRQAERCGFAYMNGTWTPSGGDTYLGACFVITFGTIKLV